MVGVGALPNFLDVQLCLTRLQSSRHVPLRSDEFTLDSEGGLTLCDSASQTTSYCCCICPFLDRRYSLQKVRHRAFVCILGSALRVQACWTTCRRPLLAICRCPPIPVAMYS